MYMKVENQEGCYPASQQKAQVFEQQSQKKEFMQPNNLIQGLVAIVMIKAGTSTSTLFFANSIYYLSYCTKIDPNLSPQAKNYTMLACALLGGTLFFYSINICRKVGVKPVALFCTAVTFISCFSAYYTTSAWVFLLCSSVLPLATFCVLAIPLLEQLWTLFAQQRQLATGLFSMIISIVSLVFSVLFFKWVNPNDISLGSASYFGSEVAMKVPTAVLRIGLFSGVALLAGCLIGLGQLTVISQRPSLNLSELPILDGRFIKLYCITAMISLFVMYFNSNFKEFLLPIYSDSTVTYLYSSISVVSTVSCFLLSWVSHHFGFINTVLGLTIAFATTAVLLGLSLIIPQVRYLAFICVLIAMAIDRALIVIIGPGLVSLFGEHLGPGLTAVKGSALVLGIIFAFILSFISSSPKTVLGLGVFSLLSPLLALGLR